MIPIPLPSTPVDLKIRGIEGLAPSDLQHEVERGAHFVIYRYTLSLVVLTLRRPSDIFFIKPGHNRIVPGLPYSLLTLLAGWWGIPWGPIYTIASLTTNFCGGTDVTEDVLKSIGQPLPPPLPASQSTLHQPVNPAKAASTGDSPARKWIVGSAVVATLIVAILGSLSLYQGSHYPIALVNGETAAYAVELDGETFSLPPGGYRIVETGTGTHNVAAKLPGGRSYARTFETGANAWDRIFNQEATVVNPDRLALIALQVSTYSINPSSHAKDDGPAPVFWPGQDVITAPRPDHFFEDFPKTISMSNKSAPVRHTQISVPTSPDLITRCNIVKEFHPSGLPGYVDAVIAHDPGDEDFLYAASFLLPSAALREVLARHIDNRPVRSLHHRYYQWLSRRSGRGDELISRYDAMLAKDPGNADLIYLRGRLEGSRASFDKYLARASSAPQPSGDAVLALAAKKLSDGQPEEAMALNEKGRSLGGDANYAKRTHNEILLYREEWDKLAEIALKRYEQHPTADGASDVISWLIHAGRKPEAEKFLAQARTRLTTGEEAEARKSTIDILNAGWAQSTGDYEESGRLLSRQQSAVHRYTGNLFLGRHAAAAQALAEFPVVSGESYFLLYVLALQQRDHATAGKYFDQAIVELSRTDAGGAALAKALKDGRLPTVDIIERSLENSELQATRLVALGCRFPELREYCFKHARECFHRKGAIRTLLEKSMQTI